MHIIYNKVFLEHDTGMHPENKNRLLCLGKLPETELKEIEAGEDEVRLVHTEKHILQVKEACEKEQMLDPDTSTSKKSYHAAVCAVGAAILASKTNGFALVRPPGHHAHPTHSGGFCLFNNIAIAAQKLVNEGKRVFILDIDGHCGDGTEQFFYKTDKVLYWSLHQSPAFPWTGAEEEIGEGKGKGYTINVPLSHGAGDDIYMKAIHIFMPIAKQFKPDVVGVSAGFDAYQHDPLLGLRLSMGCYYKIGEYLRKNFKNIFAVLEGGYNTESLPGCIFNFIDGVNEKKRRFKEHETDSRILDVEEFESMAHRIEKRLGEYWKI